MATGTMLLQHLTLRAIHVLLSRDSLYRFIPLHLIACWYILRHEANSAAPHRSAHVGQAPVARPVAVVCVLFVCGSVFGRSCVLSSVARFSAVFYFWVGMWFGLLPFCVLSIGGSVFCRVCGLSVCGSVFFQFCGLWPLSLSCLCVVRMWLSIWQFLLCPSVARASAVVVFCLYVAGSSAVFVLCGSVSALGRRLARSSSVLLLCPCIIRYSAVLLLCPHVARASATLVFCGLVFSRLCV
jgi:hypothetical protein